METDPAIAAEDSLTWGMLVHLSAFALFFTGIGYLLAPLVIWLLKRNDSSFVDEQGKEALNFQLTSTAYFVATIALSFIFNMFILLFLVLIAWMVAVTQASQAANEGRAYRYPITLRLIR